MTASRWPHRSGWRSYLFVPIRRISKATERSVRQLGPVVLDLEDGVPLAEKEEARDLVARYLRGGPPVYLRINGAQTPWFRGDLEITGSPNLLGVLLPKADSADVVRLVRQSCRTDTSLIPMIETATGLMQVNELATCEGVERLAFGAIDFRHDVGLGGAALALLYARSRMVIESRAARVLAPLDGTETELRNEKLLMVRAARSRDWGFGGKLCVHPIQATAVRRGFSPTGETLNWARQVLSAESGAPVALDGHMVDAPVRAEAERILAAADLPCGPPT